MLINNIKTMAKTSKKYQLTVSGYLYNECQTIDKVSIITKDEFEILRPLFEMISSNTDEYNWESTDSLYSEQFGAWFCHLDALYKKYNLKDVEIEKLVLRTFPKRGYVDKITAIEMAEIKIIEKFI